MTDTAMTSFGSGELQARIDMAERRQKLWLKIGSLCVILDASWVIRRLSGDSQPGRHETVMCACLFVLLVLMLALAVRAERRRTALFGHLARARLEGR
jgi:hypothetical protein